jgi:alpha-glucuronidase
LCSQLNKIETCPEIYLLWFHHVSWNHVMKNGRTLWQELCYRYKEGVNQIRQFQVVWDRIQPYIDAERFDQVQRKLREQCQNAQIWKDGCLLYFQQFSKKPIPYDIERPVYNLDELIRMDNVRHNEFK